MNKQNQKQNPPFAGQYTTKVKGTPNEDPNVGAPATITIDGDSITITIKNVDWNEARVKEDTGNATYLYLREQVGRPLNFGNRPRQLSVSVLLGLWPARTQRQTEQKPKREVMKFTF